MFIKQDEDRDRNYPAFRRYDSKNWKRWKFYPGAMLWMPIRIIAFAISCTSIAIFCAPFTCCHDFKKGPMKKGCKRTFVKWIYKTLCSLSVALTGVRTSKVYKDCDYSYYLGPNYKDNYKKVKRASTIVPNHTSWVDAMIMIKYFCPAFAPNKRFQSLPILATLCNLLDSIYIPSGGTKEKLDKALSIITERQELVE